MLQSTCVGDGCECCHRLAEVESSHQKTAAELSRTQRILGSVLEELNGCRRLLHLPSLTESNFAETPVSFVSRTPSLSTLPREILDRIVPYLGSNSIIPLCHALPQLKHLSTAIHDVRVAFKLHTSDVWPDFYFPRSTEEVSMQSLEITATNTTQCQPLDIPLRHAFKVFRLSSLLSKYGGSATILPGTPQQLSNIVSLLPTTISIHSLSDVSEYIYPHRFDQFLNQLVTTKPRIKVFEFPTKFDGCMTDGIIISEVVNALKQLQINELSFSAWIPRPIIRTLPQIRGLEALKMEDADSKFPWSILPLCKTLVRLEFEFPSFGFPTLKELVSILPRTAIRKVYFRYITLYEDELRSVTATSLETIRWSFQSGIYNQEDFIVWERLI
ncbi:hypothetical protein BCR33DRAFT_801005 [Rhizoclosmatium globosum]|uniref:F-box domain-containing protein n=1 Tax=Rhizoclosmatium globosum TaxID=329046 RepID=A0A1Y2D2B8_9FUNG|nr:hypothetical protein BCR33DRAFT_801005 [Rhizoclosmatium globosum]|eukprot:ORY53438.1 hypothetical protein BCR33DRAFT_801005 [Rhizoclosmatium globosum]